MRPENFNIDTLIEDLQGTCKTIEEFLPEGMEHDDLTEEDLLHLDNEIFLCDTCGWWCEISEQVENDNGFSVCDSCDEED